MIELELKLRQVLEQELDIYQRVLELATKKTDILKQSDIEALEALTLEEREIVLEIAMLEEKREKIIKGLAKELGVSEKLDLSSMAKYFSEEGKLGFERVKLHLNSVIEELKAVNALNETLIRDSLEYIDFSLNIMTSASVEGNYGQDIGQGRGLENTLKKNLFDGKA